MGATPKVTVFIPVYNREKYIHQAISSVLAQDYSDFELLLVDDGSDDRSIEIIRSFNDKRIRLLQNVENLGIPKTRNRGIEEAKGQYIAMLDSDDLMLPKRLSHQIRFLDKNVDYAGVGSWSRYIDEEGNVTGKIRTRPVSNKRIRSSLLFHCAIHNRTFTARSSILKQLGYDNKFRRCQDYELLSRIPRDQKLYNLPKVLVHGRKHSDQITGLTTDIGDQMKQIIASKMLTSLGMKNNQNDLENHIKIARNNSKDIESTYVEWCEDWLIRLNAANMQKNIYDRRAFSQIIFKMWIKTIYKHSQSNEYKKLFRSSLSRHALSYTVPPYL